MRYLRSVSLFMCRNTLGVNLKYQAKGHVCVSLLCTAEVRKIHSFKFPGKSDVSTKAVCRKWAHLTVINFVRIPELYRGRTHIQWPLFSCWNHQLFIVGFRIAKFSFNSCLILPFLDQNWPWYSIFRDTRNLECKRIYFMWSKEIRHLLCRSNSHTGFS